LAAFPNDPIFQDVYTNKLPIEIVEKTRTENSVSFHFNQPIKFVIGGNIVDDDDIDGDIEFITG